jgi:hypothetical protein
MNSKRTTKKSMKRSMRNGFYSFGYLENGFDYEFAKYFGFVWDVLSNGTLIVG